MKKLISILIMAFVPFFVSGQITALDLWSFKGNTFPASEPSNTFFFGTKSNHSILFKTNNIQRLKLDSNGILKSYSTNTAALNVAGGALFGSASASTGILTGTYSSVIPAVWMGTNAATPTNSNYFVLHSNNGPQFNIGGGGDRIRWNYNDATFMRFGGNGIYIGGNSNPSAYLQFAASTATLPSMLFTTGTDYSVATNGAVWYNSTTGFNFRGTQINAIGNHSVSGNSVINGSLGIGAIPNSSLSSFRIVKGTSTIDLGAPGSSLAAIWLNASTPGTSNYALYEDASNTFVNAKTGQSIFFSINASNIARVTSTGLISLGTFSSASTGTFTGDVFLTGGTRAIRGDAALELYSGGSSNLNIRCTSGAANITHQFAGVPYLTQSTLGIAVTGSISASTSILSSGITSGIGYATGSGSTVTQGTNRTTGVTINAINGAITLVSAAGSAGWTTFRVTCSAIIATDNVIVVPKDGSTDRYLVIPSRIGAGFFDISFLDLTGTTTEQPILNYTILKGVTN